MKKAIFLFFVAVLIAYTLDAQDLTCAEFTNGTFKVPKKSDGFPEYKLIRSGKSQIEVFEVSGKEMFIYGIVEWKNECSYTLKFDETKMDITEDLKFINDNGGIVTEMIKIEDKCFYYKSFLIIDGNETLRIDGSFCKE